MDVKEYQSEMVRGSVLRWQCGRKITTGGWRWEEGIGGRSQEEVTGRTVMGEWIRENTIGRCDGEDGNARVELGECDRENDNARVEWENATGRMEGIVEACPPPDTGRGRGPQDTSSAVSGTK